MWVSISVIIPEITPMNFNGGVKFLACFVIPESTDNVACRKIEASNINGEHTSFPSINYYPPEIREEGSISGVCIPTIE